MSLLSDLRAAAQALDPQFQPSANEVQGILGALVHYAEHGDEFLKAADSSVEDVAKLLQGEQAQAEPAEQPAGVVGAAAPAASEPTDDEIAKQISDLQALQASRQATAQQTTVTHETGAGVTEAGPSTPSSSGHLGWLHR